MNSKGFLKLCLCSSIWLQIFDTRSKYFNVKFNLVAQCYKLFCCSGVGAYRWAWTKKSSDGPPGAGEDGPHRGARHLLHQPPAGPGPAQLLPELLHQQPSAGSIPRLRRGQSAATALTGFVCWIGFTRQVVKISQAFVMINCHAIWKYRPQCGFHLIVVFCFRHEFVVVTLLNAG